MRYVLVTGDTNYGTVSASVTLILRRHGYKAHLFKISCDISSEVFVLADGSEVDACFGNYERILGTTFTKHNWVDNISEIDRGDADVLVIESAADADLVDKENVLLIRCVQDGEKTLVHTDSFCFTLKSDSVYKIPFILESQGFFNVLWRHLCHGRANSGEPSLEEPWVRGTSSAGDINAGILSEKQEEKVLPSTPVSTSPEREYYTAQTDMHKTYEKIAASGNLLSNIGERYVCCSCFDAAHFSRVVRIGIVGKFTKEEAYLSLSHALDFSANFLGVEIKKMFLDAEDYELDCVDCVIVPGGFGKKGVEGKILACKYARERGVPFLGICLGMQVSVIDVARHLLGLRHASSHEFGDTPHPVVTFLGRRRLGSIEIGLQGRVREIYRSSTVVERHRHEFGVSPKYIHMLESHLELSCTEGVVEAAVLRDHIFHVSVQYHPEFLAQPDAPHPLVTELIKHGLSKK
eukprot:jgi/Antlo1/2203/1281